MKSLNFYLVTDTHYFEPSLGASGKGYDEYMKSEQMCLAENANIVKATFREIANDSDVDIVLIAGDLTKNGEKESHRGFKKELYKLRDAGKRIYVITARHDFNDSPRGYKNDGFVPVEGTSRFELSELYDDFGYKDAIAFDEISLSYVAELCDGVRLLAINCDGQSEKEKGSIDENLMGWIEKQAKKAKEDNCFMFAMNHYPIIPSVPVFDLVGDAKLKNWRSVAEVFPEWGINLIFTGHMHIQSVNEYINKNGKKFYDVCTSALVGSPGKYRRIEITEDKQVKIASKDIPSFDWDLGGLSPREYLDKRFYSMIQHKINRALSGKGAKAAARKIFNTITLKSAGRLLFIKVPKQLRDEKLADVVAEIGVSIFAGDMPYKKGDPKGELIIKALKRFKPIIKFAEKKIIKNDNITDLTEMLLTSVGKAGVYSDNDTVFNLQDTK
ncbi:MAG TPA: metallophosphoesterase [Clostridia bacterium]|nr:metallophosphoesterase [Clostridia bacterium]